MSGFGNYNFTGSGTGSKNGYNAGGTQPYETTMDECSPSLCKPLSLRQQTEKPVLKYSGMASNVISSPVITSNLSRPAAVPLFSHADIQYLRQQVQQYSTPPAMLNNVLFTSFIHKPPQLPGYTQPLTNSSISNVSGLQSTMAAQPPVGTVANITRNPYMRLISAKGIQSPDDGVMHQGSTVIQSTSSSLGSNGSHTVPSVGTTPVPPSSSVTYDSSIPTSSTVIQPNFFMKPQTTTVSSPNHQQQYKSEKRSTHSTINVRETKIGNVIYKPNGMLTKDPCSTPLVINNNRDEKSLLTAVNGMTLQSVINNMEGSIRSSQSSSSKPGHVTVNAVIKPNSKSIVVTVPRPPTGSKPTTTRQVHVKTNPTPTASSGASNQSHSTSASSYRFVTNIPDHPGPKLATKVNETVPDSSRISSQQTGVKVENGKEVKPDHSSSGTKDSGTNKLMDNMIPKSSIPRPGTAAKSRPVSSGSTRTELPERVRNLNYTPTKPYSEVNNNQLDRSTPFRSDNNSCVNNNNPIAIRNNVTPTSGQTGKLSTDTSVIDKKPLITNSPKHTVYYRKDSKTEVALHKPRPRPVTGALGKTNFGEHQNQDPTPGTAGNTRRRSQEEDVEEWEDEAEEGVQAERLPEDGQDLDEDDDDDDEGDFDEDDVGFEDDDLDDLDDDVDDGSDEGSACFSRSSSARSRTNLRIHSATKKLLGLSIKDRQTSSQPSPTRSRPTTARRRPISAVSTLSSDSDVQVALTASLFPNIPPTINFVDVGEKVEQLPWEIRKMLKWRMSPITPNVVKNCIGRSGFRPSKNNHDWLGYWGKHMKAQGFKAVREYQKVNHFPGSFQIGRKDRLWRNLSRLQVQYGKKEFGFFPQTFILPTDLKLLKRAWEEGGSKQKWITKPPASARGIGIRVISKWNQIPRRRSVIVQRYLARPFLINESKFDLRIYVYVTSYDPLRIYVYDDGLVRFASCKYSYAMKSLSNKYMHLTNYSINKNNNEYQSNSDEKLCQGHKWGLKALWGYMKKQGIDTNRVWQNMIDLIIKTIISSEACVNSLVKANVRRRYSCHELFGFDIMLDDQLKPWIIEVNISPSLHSNSSLDINIKGGMIKDLMNLSGYLIPDRREVAPSSGSPAEPSSKYQIPKEICMDRRLYPQQLSPDEKSKHAYYCQRANDEFAQQTILDILTPDDIRILTETLDEGSRRGNFIQAFPNTTSHKYRRFFDAPRYYNLMLQAWLAKYGRTEVRGIMVLENLCNQGIHLESPTDDPRHQWGPPSPSSLREPRAVSSAPGIINKSSGPNFPKLKKRVVKVKPWHQGAAVLSTCSTSSMSSTSSTPVRPPRSAPGGSTEPS